MRFKINISKASLFGNVKIEADKPFLRIICQFWELFICLTLPKYVKTATICTNNIKCNKFIQYEGFMGISLF